MEKTNEEKIILCNNPKESGGDVSFNLWGNQGNVNLEIETLKGLFPGVSERLQDFLEIATYVYCADQYYVRYQGIVDPYGKCWHRNLKLVIAVRDLDFWKRSEVKVCLERLLGFLADEKISFEFVHLTEEPPEQLYFKFQESDEKVKHPTQVMLYSGGLDSLGGAIHEAMENRNRVILVRHKSTNKFNKRHQTLNEMLVKKCGANPPIFISQVINKHASLSNEYTQCTRSFLYFALGATVANMLGLDNIRFYENGPVSINLPLAQQVIGGRATRTTHPKVLNGFQKLMTLITDKPFTVENPFLKKTKKEILDLIVLHNCAELIQYSTSCAHTGFARCSNIKPQCGTCSQCIDRRFAIAAGGYEKYEDVDSYLFDIFKDDLSQTNLKLEDKMTLTCYIERAVRMLGMSLYEFEVEYPEVAAATGFMGTSPAKATAEIYNLYQNHAKEINSVIECIVEKNIPAFIKGTLPAESLPRILVDNPTVRREILPPVKEKPVPYIEKIITGDTVVWKIDGEARQFKYREATLHSKFLNALYDVYKVHPDWIPHQTFQNLSGWTDKQYWGNGKENNSGLAQRRMSEIRNALGIEITYDREKGFMIPPTVKS